MIEIESFYTPINSSFQGQQKKMLINLFAMDDINIPEKQEGELLYLRNQTIALLQNMELVIDKVVLENFIYHAIAKIGKSQRKGKYFFINHAGIKSPKGDDIKWFIQNWIKDAMKAIQKNDNDLLWGCLLDMEILAPANAMNSSISQILWSYLRLLVDKPIAYIPRKNMLKYKHEILRRRIDKESYFTFKQIIT